MNILKKINRVFHGGTWCVALKERLICIVFKIKFTLEKLLFLMEADIWVLPLMNLILLWEKNLYCQIESKYTYYEVVFQ